MEHTITEAAQEALQHESADYAKRLRETAVKEALTARGTPVEVTASDVRKAAQALRAVRIAELAKSSTTYRLIEAYFWGGIAITVMSLITLAVRNYFGLGLLDVSDRYLSLLGLSGAAFAAMSGGMRWYLKHQARQ